MDRTRTIPIMSQADVYAARMITRQTAIEIGLSLIDQARISLAASSLAGCLKMGGSGSLPDQILISNITEENRTGLRLMFITQHPDRRECLSHELDKIRDLVDVESIDELPRGAVRVTLVKWLQSELAPKG